MDIDSDIPVNGTLTPEVLMLLSLLPILLDEEDPITQHDSALSGQAYYDELMSTESSHRLISSKNGKSHFYFSSRYANKYW